MKNFFAPSMFLMLLVYCIPTRALTPRELEQKLETIAQESLFNAEQFGRIQAQTAREQAYHVLQKAGKNKKAMNSRHFKHLKYLAHKTVDQAEELESQLKELEYA